MASPVTGELPEEAGRQGPLAIEPSAPAIPWQIFDDAAEALLVVDGGQRIVAVNQTFAELVGRSKRALRGEPLATFLTMPSAAVEEGLGALDEQAAYAQVTCRDASGEARSALLSLGPLRMTPAGARRTVVLVDLSRLAEPGAAPAASREVYFDALTGLPNLQLVTQLIHDAMRHAETTGGELTICALDLDHFKALNDRMGESTGNVLLSTFAQRISHLVAGDDVLARVGGDEFVLVLHRDADDACLEALLNAIRQPLRLGGRMVRLTASLGATHFPRDVANSEGLLRHATQAMYRAKQRGRDTFHRFDPALDLALQVRQERRRRFAQAVTGGELRLHYQPQVDMTSGEVVGVEALVRWQHPEEGLLAPGLFLPDIAGTRYETMLGEWVLEQALCQLQAWRAVGLELPISVNISPAHLLQEGFAPRLGALLEAHPQVPPQQLNLEVLETAAMHDIDSALVAIQRCQALGVRVAIDDFGTGFSSLTYLRQLPVDLIKIDRSFVCDMLTDRDDMAIVESIIYMANRFERPLLAEGVETLAHAQALASAGCTLAQGFGIARPMPPESLPAWLHDWPQRSEWVGV